jgi:putative Mg2+ transporter-C (MgtC) family protein
MISPPGWGDIALRLALAVLAGIVIGTNRSRHAEPAGMRTMVLVCVAACVAMLQADVLFAYLPDLHKSNVSLDFMRLPLGILSGIGFIGGGAILRRGEMVQGVTTAATLWLVTVAGLCFGGGQLGLGIATAGIGLAALWPLKSLELLLNLGHHGTLIVEVQEGGPDEAEVLALLRARRFILRARAVTSEPGHRRGSLRFTGRYSGDFPGWSSELVRTMAGRAGVLRVEWRDAD